MALAMFGALASCEDSTEKPVVSEKFEGILRCDEDSILGGDTSDFQPRPIPSDIDTTVFPPLIGPIKNTALGWSCPNPSDAASVMYFQLSEPEDSVWVLVYDKPDAPPVDTLFSQQNAGVGSYTVMWEAPNGPGIYRIKMFTASGFHSYGDVEFTGGSSGP